MRCKIVANPICRYRRPTFGVYMAAMMRGVELPVQEPNIKPGESPNCLPMCDLTTYLCPRRLTRLAIRITISTQSFVPNPNGASHPYSKKRGTKQYPALLGCLRQG